MADPDFSSLTATQRAQLAGVRRFIGTQHTLVETYSGPHDDFPDIMVTRYGVQGRPDLSIETYTRLDMHTETYVPGPPITGTVLRITTPGGVQQHAIYDHHDGQAHTQHDFISATGEGNTTAGIPRPPIDADDTTRVVPASRRDARFHALVTGQPDPDPTLVPGR